VHFYASREALAEIVAEFLAGSLGAGGAAVVIATEEHWKAIERALSARGIDCRAALSAERLVALDAAETLSSVLADGWPDPARFRAAIGDRIAALCRTEPASSVRVYGELVDLLWREGRSAAALRLEEMWNALRDESAFGLLCAYAMAGFYREPRELRAVSTPHTHLELGESDEPALAALAQEIAARKELERGLRDALSQLSTREESLARASERLTTIADALPTLVSFIDPELRYRFVNASYEQWFGVRKEDVVGHRVRDVVGELAFTKIEPHLRAALQGETVSFRTRIPYELAGERVVEATYVPRLDARGAVSGVVAMVSDDTHNAALQAAREASARRSERLVAMTAAIAKAVTREEVYAAIVDGVGAAAGASTAGLWIADDERRTARLVRSFGYNDAAQARIAEVPLDAPAVRFPALDCLRSGRPLSIPSQAALLREYPELAAISTRGREYRLVCVPIAVQGKTLGTLALTFESARPDAEEESFVFVAAGYAAQAIERVRLLDAERASRARAEAFAARNALTSIVSRDLARAGTDVDAVLESVAARVTGEHADACAILLVAPGGTMRLAAAGGRSDLTRVIRDVFERHPPRIGAGLAGKVAASGTTSFIPVVDREQYLQSLEPEHRELGREHVPTSLIVAPLRARSGTIGVLTVARDGSSPPFTEEDRQLFEDLAERTALAIDLARAYVQRDEMRSRAERLYALARSILVADGPGGVYEAALDAIGDALQTPRASILVFDREGVMRFRAWRRLSDRYRTAVEGHSPWSPGEARPQPIVIEDVAREPSLAAFLPLFRSEGIAALAFIPLVASGQLLGKFMVYYDRPRALASTELDLAQAIADHVAGAIARFAAKAELEETVRWSEKFMAVLGHDLRNPLAAIGAAAEVARLHAKSETAVTYLAKISTSGERMARMIDQLLDFARVRLAQGLPLSPRPIDLKAVLRQAADELAAAHPISPVSLTSEGDLSGSWDPDRLLQLFSNLIANAIQHAAQPGVTIRARSEGATVCVDIQNAGAVAPERLNDLFEPLAGRERHRRSSKSSGLGLGLYIAREIARAHGGSIEVRSSESEGTTFSVRLPAQAIEAQPAARRVPALPEPASNIEESAFRQLVESVRDYAIFLLDPEGRIRTWNRGAELLKGYRESEIVGRSFDVFYTPEDAALGRPRSLLAEAANVGRVEVEGWRVRKDGSRFWADVVLTALRDERGKLQGFAKVTRDLSARRSAEQALRESEERFRLLIDTVSDYAIFMLDPDGRVSVWNAGGERLTGWRAADVVGRHHALFYAEEDVRAGRCEQVLAAARGGPVRDRGWRVRKDGSRFWADVSIAPLTGASGDLIGFANVTHDLTERQHAEAERTQLLQAEEALALRDEFLAIASHEIRTPLTAIHLQLDALLAHEHEDSTRTSLERMKRTGQRLSDLTDSLLDASLIAAGQLVLNREVLDLGEVVTGVCASLEPAAARARCPLSCSAQSVAGRWDRVRVEQICTNLLSNALKFGAGAPVAVTVKREADLGVIEVADRGPGVPEKDLARIFGRFERAMPRLQYGGLGLGLYVAREITNAHGGTIRAASSPGGGTTFTVRLPIEGASNPS
jgi:PAS domain S-box-containing protein